MLLPKNGLYTSLQSARQAQTSIGK